jgi:MscS family membrane protein
MTHRVVEESIAVRYEDLGRIPKIIEEIRTLLEGHKGVDQHLPLCVFLEKFADTAIQIEIKAYILSTRYEEFMEIRQGMLSDVYCIMQRAGAEMPYPTMQVKIQGNLI